MNKNKNLLSPDGFLAKNIDQEKIEKLVKKSKEYDYNRVVSPTKKSITIPLLLSKSTFLDYVLYFFLYSAIGWAGESAYCSVGAGKFINRGFLLGPMCPIYGSGATLISILLSPIYNRFGKSAGEKLLSFVVSAVGCDILEYITSVLMEKLFNARWWDYTDEPFNFNGRICLKHTMYWGIAGVVFRYMIHPFVTGLKAKYVSDLSRDIILGVVLAVFAVDLIFAVLSASNLKKYTTKIGDAASDIADTMKFLFDEAGATIDDISDRVSELSADTFDAVADKVADISIKLTETENKFKKSFNANVKEKITKENVIDKLTQRHIQKSHLGSSVKKKFASAKDTLSDLTDIIKGL